MRLLGASPSAGSGALGPLQRYEALQAFPENLSRGPIELPGGWLAVGDTGWYDYSFGDPSFSLADFDRRQLEGRLWQDRVRAPWDRPARDVHRWFLRRLQRELEGRRRLTEGSTLFVCNCLGYASEWGADRDPALEAEQALLTLEL